MDRTVGKVFQDFSISQIYDEKTVYDSRGEWIFIVLVNNKCMHKSNYNCYNINQNLLNA